MSAEGSPAEPQRPRLKLKPRDEDAARRLSVERANSAKNPFGGAKPREAVLSQRTGKTETDILKEEVKAEKPKLRLNAQQLEEKRTAEAAVDEIKELVAAETDPVSKAGLEEELKARKAALDELMDGFVKLALEAVAKGEAVRPSERRRQLEGQDAPVYGDGRPGGDGYSTGKGQYGGGSYNDGGGRGYRDGGGYREGGAREGGGGYRDAAGGREGGGYREGGRGGGFRDFNDRGGFGRSGGSRGFSNYEERDFGGRPPGGGYNEGGRRYEQREYRGASDYDNAETFGVSTANGGRYGGRGGGGRGGGRHHNRGFDEFPGGLPGMGGSLAASGGYQDSSEYGGTYAGQDRY